MVVEQFLPAFHYGDAIGNSTLRYHRYLQGIGVESRIIAMTADESIAHLAIPFDGYQDNPHSIKILHFAVPSALTDFFLQTGGKKAMIYHNITPAHFFVDFSDELVRFTNEGRKHLARLSSCFDLSIADSGYNASELEKLNFTNVSVFPITINLEEYAQPHSQPYQNLLKDERKNILFVGRITPNKKIEDLIKMVFFYKKYLSPSIRLIVAGNSRTLPKYFLALKDLAARFHLTAEDVIFTGHIPFDELLTLYRLADVFVSMSEHEGFCLPLIESCIFQLPVVAFAAGAVAETLAGAGIVIHSKEVEYVAGVVEKVINNASLREKLRKKSQQRHERYKKESDPALLHSLLEENFQAND